MFRPMENTPADLVAFEAEGRISDSDYKDILVPAIDAAVAAHGKVRIVLRFGPAFEGYTAHAMLDDALLGLAHWSHFERLAIVTDVDWIDHGLRLFAPLIPGKTRVFPADATQEALSWAAA